MQLGQDTAHKLLSFKGPVDNEKETPAVPGIEPA